MLDIMDMRCSGCKNETCPKDISVCFPELRKISRKRHAVSKAFTEMDTMRTQSRVPDQYAERMIAAAKANA